jgi:hypothetical protein
VSAVDRSYGGGLCSDVSERGVLTGRLTCATVSGLSQRQQVESRSHRWPPRFSGPVTGTPDVPVPPSADGLTAVIGRHRALLMQGFFADGVVSQPLTPHGAGGGGN